MVHSNNHFIDDCFQEKSLKIIQVIFENNDNDSLTREEVTHEFKRIWNIIIGPDTTMSSVTKKSYKRCIMINKTGKRCSLKVNSKDHNSNICTFHTNKQLQQVTIIEDMIIPDFEKLSM